MVVVLLSDSRAMHVQASPFVYTQKRADGLYSLEAQLLNIDAANPDTILIFQDDVQIAEGDEITDAIRAKAQPFFMFECATKEQAQAEALGMIIRASVAAGTVTDEELLRIAPALADREWKPDLSVVPGDVYSFGGLLYRCVQAHTTQASWQPDRLPALWRRVRPEAAVEIWQVNTDYATGDVVAYPDEATLYTCVQGHTSQTGWEPPNLPALWKKHTAMIT